MMVYAAAESQGRIIPLSHPGGPPRGDHRMALMMSRLEFDIHIVDIPNARREVRPVLELKIASLYPGSPEETVFDFRPIGGGKAILFITSRATLEGYRKTWQKTVLFPSYALVKRYVASGEKTVCSFWWYDWVEIWLFEGNRPLESLVFRRSADLRLDSAELDSHIPEGFAEASHILFCPREMHTQMDGFSLVRSPDFRRSIIIEEAIGRVRRRKDFIFELHVPLLHRYRGAFIVFCLLLAGLLFAGAMERRFVVRRELREELAERLQGVRESEEIRTRISALEAELQTLDGIRPVNLYRFLLELPELLGPDTDVQQLTIEGGDRFQIEGRNSEPFFLVSAAEGNRRFSGLKLPRIVKDHRSGKERFSLAGYYHE